MNNNYIIREIKEDEIDYANKLLNKLIIEEKQYDENINQNYIVNNYYQKRQKDSILLVATLNNEIVAFLFGYTIEALVYTNRKAVLDALYVLPDHRKHGIASLLIDNFKKWCMQQNITNLELTVFSNNINALSLYKNHGFEIEKYTMKLKIVP